MLKKYCEIAQDVCPNGINDLNPESKVFCAYSSGNSDFLKEIRDTLPKLNANSGIRWTSWEEDLEIENRMIFCAICKEIVSSKAVFIELSDLNFNVIFEYGYAIAFDKKIRPAVNSKFDFQDIERYLSPLMGIGLAKYNKGKLYDKIMKKTKFWEGRPQQNVYSLNPSEHLGNETKIESNSVLYLSNIDDEAVTAAIEHEIDTRWERIDFIKDDPTTETHDLQWYSTRIKRSYAVIIDLGKSGSNDNPRHFLKSALVAGMSIGAGRRVLLINSSKNKKPADITTIINSYENAKQARNLVHKFLDKHVNSIALINAYLETKLKDQVSAFNDIRVGDWVAENDRTYLSKCFLRTSEINSLPKVGYKLVIGRKGTGKTAAFFNMKTILNNNSISVIQLMLERYQMDDIYRLTQRFNDISDQEKILRSFWEYILYSLLIRKLLKPNTIINEYDFNESEKEKLEGIFNSLPFSENDSSITETLDDIIDQINEQDRFTLKRVKSTFYEKHITMLKKVIQEYTKRMDAKICINIDGLDSNLNKNSDMNMVSLILYSLHDVLIDLSRKVLKNSRVNLFIRKDLFEAFEDRISEKDKVDKIFLNWNEENLIKIINLRLQEHQIDHIIEILSPDLNIIDIMNKMKVFVYKRPRDYIFMFDKLIENAKAYHTQEINRKVFNISLSDYTWHVNESLEAELISMPFNFRLTTLFNKIKLENNNKDRIPYLKLDQCLESLTLNSDQKSTLILFFLKNSVLQLRENNDIVNWNDLIDPESKLNILRSSSKRLFLSFHPIIQRLLEKRY